jgi:hypothetical protein
VASQTPSTDGVERAPRDAARSAHLRYVSDDEPGIRRLRSGRSFAYVRPSGARVARNSADHRRILLHLKIQCDGESKKFAKFFGNLVSMHSARTQSLWFYRHFSLLSFSHLVLCSKSRTS